LICCINVLIIIIIIIIILIINTIVPIYMALEWMN
jgi:hypothetical protein